MAAELMNVDNAIKVLQMTLKFTMERVDDWQNVGPEGKALKKECQLFHTLTHDLLDKEHLPIHDILQDTSNTLETTNKLIDDFLEKDGRTDRSIFSKTGWGMKRVYLAWDYRAVFKGTTAHLESNKEKIESILDFSAKINKPTVHWYRGDLPNHESFLFWKDICGEDIQSANDGAWTLFTQTYQAKYGVELKGDMIERIKRVACRNGTNLTIGGFILLTRLCDFPLNLDRLPSVMNSHATESAETRMSVAKMIDDLIAYYATKEMRDLIVAIYNWYKNCKRTNGKEDYNRQVAARAEQWARIIMTNRGKTHEEMNEEEQLAEQVDMARRTYSFFFQRYMVVFKIGQLSKELFEEVDFPGKARMREFLNFVQPLDYANYHIVMNKGDAEWKKKKPKVYTFLEEFLEEEEQKKKKESKQIQQNNDSNGAPPSPSPSAAVEATAISTNTLNDDQIHYNSKVEVPSNQPQI